MKQSFLFQGAFNKSVIFNVFFADNLSVWHAFIKQLFRAKRESPRAVRSRGFGYGFEAVGIRVKQASKVNMPFKLNFEMISFYYRHPPASRISGEKVFWPTCFGS
jgi:hypothetical protein